eukprot:6400605-Pyramimonas_sp.AAC.1
MPLGSNGTQDPKACVPDWNLDFHTINTRRISLLLQNETPSRGRPIGDPTCLGRFRNQDVIQSLQPPRKPLV